MGHISQALSITDGNEIHVPGHKLEINLCLCTRKSVCVYVCMLEIFCFLSFKDLITPVGGVAIYSSFGSKNIGMKEVFGSRGPLVSQA